MSSRYRDRDPEMLEPPQRNKCSRVLYYTWKVITCIFSHITLMCMVVLYCLLGAWAFAKLEADNEKDVKRSIAKIRENVTEYIWLLTSNSPYLEEGNWTLVVKERLKRFENDLLWAMTKDGWDGNEDTETIQWTFAGALFYSIIVITTIGYGHIAPKTHWGKVVTIFYAILGIPLMLLCLSNIGDIMATSFRFLYWKVCCYMCTKKPKRSKRPRSNRSTIRTQGRYSARSRTASFKRSGRNSQRSADSGFGLSEITSPVSYSDTDLRYTDNPGHNPPQMLRGSSLPRMRASQVSRYSDSTVPSHTAGPSVGRRPSPGTARPRPLQARGGSLDRRRQPPPPLSLQPDLALEGADATPVLCNKYVIDAVDGQQLVNNNNTRRLSAQTSPGRRAISVPRQQNYLEPPRAPSPEPEPSVDLKRSARRRPQSPQYNPSPSIMSPMGFTVHRQKYFDEQDSDADYYEEGYYVEGARSRIKPVPIWLCVFLVVSYIFGGAFLFTTWENWEYLDSAYFCFITLTTIGFGDFVPAKRVAMNAEVSIALCSLYLLFGISLLAMSFNLVQEEVIANVKSVAKTLGIIKSEDDDEEEED